MLPKELHEEALLGFDGTVYRFDSGYEISLAFGELTRAKMFSTWISLLVCAPRPGSNGQPSARIFGYDDAHAPTDTKRPHDHLHKTKRGPGGHPVRVKRNRFSVLLLSTS